MLSITIKMPLKFLIVASTLNIRTASSARLWIYPCSLPPEILSLLTIYFCWLNNEFQQVFRMKIKLVLLKCNDSSVLLSSCSISKRHSNYSLIAARRSHIDIHRKWEHEIMFVLGNSAAMETGWCNCSKQYAVSNARAHYCICTFYRLSNKPPVLSFFFFVFLFFQSFGCAITSCVPRFLTPTIWWMLSKLLKVFFFPSLCQHPAASWYLSLFVKRVCSCLAPSRQLGIPLHFMHCHLF